MFKDRWPCYAGLGIIIIVCFCWWWFCGAHTTVLLVRHGERDDNIDALNLDGQARAVELLHVAEKAGIEAIVRSNTVRTQQTAEPLATALGLTPIVINGNAQAFADEIRNNHRGETVLVVGHSDSVPDIIEDLGGPALPNIDGTEFDNLFVLELCRCRRGTAHLTNLQYGAVSP